MISDKDILKMSAEEIIGFVGVKLTQMSNEEGRQPDEWVVIGDMHSCVVELQENLKELREREKQNLSMKG